MQPQAESFYLNSWQSCLVVVLLSKLIHRVLTFLLLAIQVVMMYTVGVAISLFSFWQMPANIAWAQWLNVFMVGFFLYGPQMLIGLCGAELVGKESVGASEGFLGWVAYLGAANAGIPLSIIVRNYGWNYYFLALIVSCGCAMLLLAPMVNLKNHVQREAEKLQAA